jgi:hypothetical protein
MTHLTMLAPDIVAAILDDVLLNHITLFGLWLIRRCCGRSSGSVSRKCYLNELEKYLE